ncbi:hypothetical protein [Streptomyces sp. LX-29]|nr:hypothetical protein [Streptomyces sp. LX-29]
MNFGLFDLVGKQLSLGGGQRVELHGGKSDAQALAQAPIRLAILQ